MNREILFRGLRTSGKGWAFGSLILPAPHEDHTIIKGWNSAKLKVTPETIGQYTGLKDKNGVKIFEGDNFNPDLGFDEVEAVVRWDEDGVKFVVDSYGYGHLIGEGGQEIYSNELSVCSSYDLSDIRLEHTEVIGNIHQTK